MQVSRTNDVNIYNLSAGKSLPEWIDQRKKKQLLKNDVGLQKRIELLQDFDMPVVSTRVNLSKDGRYILALGTYKPRVRCYEVDQLGLKFERCFDSEAVAFRLISDDYSKMIILHCDRYVNLHAQGGQYYRLRIPKFGRDLAYHPQTCDALFVGDGSHVHRLNLEQGRFLQPWETQAAGSNVIEVNPEHQLVVVGTTDGRVEAWDPRKVVIYTVSRQRVSTLDCLKHQSEELAPGQSPAISEITALAFRDALNLGVGNSTGKIMLYDIRSSKPYQVKDHMYDAPIKKIIFHSTHDQVLSVDERVVKIWDRNSGKAFTSIESEHGLNDLAIYPGSGLLFMANEQPKMQAHYIPALGPAPRWCSFLDNMTDELEESATTDLYDDYKFVTLEELTDLGLDHLIGTDMLRAYMHGYFVDIRLYRKARDIIEPFTKKRYMEEKVRKKLEDMRENRVKLKEKLPEVNKELFVKLKERKALNREKKTKDTSSQLLEDDRFKAMFSDERFAVDTNEEAYKLLNPVLSKMDEKAKKKFEEMSEEENVMSAESEDESGLTHRDMEDTSEEEESSSEEDEPSLRNRMAASETDQDNGLDGNGEARPSGSSTGNSLSLSRTSACQNRKKLVTNYVPNRGSNFKLYEMKDGQNIFTGTTKAKKNKASLEERLKSEEMQTIRNHSEGHEMIFSAKKSTTAIREALAKKEHMKERQKIRRSVGSLKNKRKKNTIL